MFYFFLRKKISFYAFKVDPKTKCYVLYSQIYKSCLFYLKQLRIYNSFPEQTNALHKCLKVAAAALRPGRRALANCLKCKSTGIIGLCV